MILIVIFFEADNFFQVYCCIRRISNEKPNRTPIFSGKKN